LRALIAPPQLLAGQDRGRLVAALLLGVGIGICFPILSAASVSAIPAARFAVGGAVNQTARQVGAVVGVALAIAVLGSASAATGLASIDAWFELSAVIALAAAAVSVAIGSLAAPKLVGVRPEHA
jgi:hypothetical protein